MDAERAIEQITSALRLCASQNEFASTLLAQARKMLGAGEAYIVLREAHSFRLHSADGLPREAQTSNLNWEGTIEGLGAAQASPIVLTDASRYLRFRDPIGRPRPVGAMAVYPIMARGEGIGAIVVTRPTPGDFSASDLRWLSLLAGVAAVVIENERARRVQERRAHQAEVLLDVVAQSGGEPENLLQRLADTLTRDLNVDRVDVLLLDSQRQVLACLGTATAPGEQNCAAEPVPIANGGALARVLETGQTHLETGGISDPVLQQRFRGTGMRSALVAPIPVEGQRRGVLLLAATEPDAFGSDDQAFALVVAARIGVLIQDAELRKRRREVELAETEASARQQFVGVVSHELKTPVAVIQAYADVLLRRAERAGDKANIDVINRIREQSERMLYMVDQVLDLQRLEGGMMSLEPSRFDLAALARRVAEEMGTLSQKHRLLAPDRGPVYVVADRRRLEQVLSNLLQNAIKYSPAGGDVTVRVRPDPEKQERALVSVSDQGLGIAPEEQAHVFDRFYQGRHRLHEGHVGLGLGLYISRELVRRHGGEMWVESEPGHGSTFHFWIPRSGPEENEPWADQ